jgi:hypothetical protein
VEQVRLRKRDRVIVHLRSARRVSGRYLGTHGPTSRDPESYLLIDNEPRAQSVRVSDVCGISVEVTGKGWMYGMLIGAALDTAVVVATVIALENMSFSGDWGGDGDGGCFC